VAAAAQQLASLKVQAAYQVVDRLMHHQVDFHLDWIVDHPAVQPVVLVFWPD